MDAHSREREVAATAGDLPDADMPDSIEEGQEGEATRRVFVRTE
jgi:hypothetical protein